MLASKRHTIDRLPNPVKTELEDNPFRWAGLSAVMADIVLSGPIKLIAGQAGTLNISSGTSDEFLQNTAFSYLFCDAALFFADKYPALKPVAGIALVTGSAFMCMAGIADPDRILISYASGSFMAAGASIALEDPLRYLAKKIEECPKSTSELFNKIAETKLFNTITKATQTVLNHPVETILIGVQPLTGFAPLIWQLSKDHDPWTIGIATTLWGISSYFFSLGCAGTQELMQERKTINGPPSPNT